MPKDLSQNDQLPIRIVLASAAMLDDATIIDDRCI